MSVPLFVKVLPVYAVFAVMFLSPIIKTVDPPISTVDSTSTQIRTNDTPTERALALESPNRIRIPAIDLSLSVVDGVTDYKNNTWNVDEGVANFMTESAKPNPVGGKVVLYAHDRNNGFKAIHKLKTGDVAYVDTGSTTYSYIFRKSEVVKPTDTHVLAQKSASPELLLLTCDGFWSSDRYTAEFELIK